MKSSIAIFPSEAAGLSAAGGADRAGAFSGATGGVAGGSASAGFAFLV
jgi:hypothetical protein